MKTTSDPNRPHAQPRTIAVALILCLIAAGPAAAEPPAPEEIVAALTDLRAELEWPGLTVAEAAENLKTPAEALRFVSDEVMLLNYSGAYSGPAAVLRTRVANATDKSELLAALLTQMGYQARLAKSDWPEDAQPYQGAGPNRELPAMAQLQALLATEAPQDDPPTPGPTDEQLQALIDEITSAAATIEQQLAASDRADLLAGTPDADDTPPTWTDTNWVWVQVQLDGEAWTDMDAVFPDRPRPASPTAPFVAKPVTFSLRLEAVQADQEAQVVLQWSGPCRDILGYDLQISYFPASGDMEDVEQPELIARWKPQLTAGPLSVAGELFAPAGGPAKDDEAEPDAAPAGGFGGFGGFGGGAPAPAPAPTGSEFLRLVIQFNDPDGRTRSMTFSRVLQYVGEGYDPYELIAVHRIYVGMAFAPVRVVESRMVDEAIAAYQLRQLADGEIDKLPPTRGISTRTTRVLNSMFFLKTLAVPTELKLAWQGPAVFVETAQLQKVEGERYFAARLDTLAEAFAPAPGSTRKQRMLWGLATCAVEARLLGGVSVNQHLLDAGDSVRVVGQADDSLPASLDDAMQKAVLAEGGVLLASDDAPGSVWAVRPTGDVVGIFVEPTSGAAAKGAGRSSRSREAANNFAALGEAAMGMMGSPAGMLINPLHAYFVELAKAYEAAANVLDNLATSIETGDASHMNDSQDEYFRDIARHLVNAISRGFVRGWAESALGAGIGHALGTSGSQRIADRIIDGLIAGGLSLPDEFVIFPELMEDAMNGVSIPAGEPAGEQPAE